MGGLFNRLKIWAFEEVLKSQDLNDEFNNIINNLGPATISSYSSTVMQMQIQTDPGELNSENLPISLANEITDLRFVIARITGETYWYESAPISLVQANNILNDAIGLPQNRIVSGLTTGRSSAPCYLVPSGSGLSVTLKASPSHPFICVINGTQYEFTSDIVLTGLTPAPSSQNTATVNGDFFTACAGERWTRLSGEQQDQLSIASAGTNITNKVGFVIALQNPNSLNEIFVSRLVDSGSISNAYRGYFFDSTGTPIPRDILNNGDVLNLLSLAYIFITTAGTLDVTYNEPQYNGTAPSTPATGDYWFDESTSQWMKYSGTMFTVANATLVGLAASNTTTTIGARSEDFFNVYSRINSMLLEGGGTSLAISTLTASASVYGTQMSFKNALEWDYPSSLDTGLTATDQEWYAYLTEKGNTVISDQHPYDRFGDLKGWYHPYESWLCVAGFFVGAAGPFGTTGQIFSPSLYSFSCVNPEDMPGQIAMDLSFFRVGRPRGGYIPLDGTVQGYGSRALYHRLYSFIGTCCGDGSAISDTNFFTLPTANGYFPRFYDPTAGTDGGSRTGFDAGGNTGFALGTVEADQNLTHDHVAYAGHSGSGSENRIAPDSPSPPTGGGGSFVTVTNSLTSGIQSSGGNESRPYNFMVGIWLKV